MDLDAKVYIAGHRGLVGSAIMRQLQKEGYTNIVTRTHAELDLTNQTDVREFFFEEQPEYVFVCAAKVGGILANNTYPADFIYQNLAIQTNIIHESYKSGVRRLLFLGSSCIYPRDCPQPIKEEYLQTGPLEVSNRPYAIAKISGIEMCWSYNRQYGTRFLSAMPTNTYGPGDNYDLRNSHVLPALIRKMHEAKEKEAKEVIVWGTGQPKREFIYSDDLAGACIYLLTLSDEKLEPIISYEKPPLINVGVGSDVTIKDLAEQVAQIVGYEGAVKFDDTMPDGTPRKILDSSLLSQLGWRSKTSLMLGIEKTYSEYLLSLDR